MKVICYALFGYNKERQSNCFDFNSYLRGMMMCIRVNRLLYPDWITRIETDKATYTAFSSLFHELDKSVMFQFNINEEAQLTKAMLWRLKPLFEGEDFTHVICRDLDSPATYREVQAVRYWINKEKAAHAITDSVSHTIPMLGGMIGFVPKWFTMRTEFKTWDEMFNGCTLDFNRKGADQDFLTQYVYPKFAQHGSDSITQHYFNGMSNTFLSDYKTCTCPPTSGHKQGCENNMDLGLDGVMKESNSICGHIGASGCYTGAMHQFLNKFYDKFEDIRNAEKPYSDVFYWLNEKLF